MHVCSRCGQQNPEGARYCNACAAPLLDGAAPLEARKLVTILFCDIVGSTATAERLDPEDVRAFLVPYYAHVRSELEHFGGTVEKFIGDAVMAVFGARVAHEDDPERAVRAALAIRDWLGEPDRPQQARIAVSTGEAHVTVGAAGTEGEPLAVGDVVNTAARLQAAAPVNGVLVGEQTFRATRHAIEYRASEPITAKGKSAPVRVWEAIRVLAQPGIDPSRHHSPFIGRKQELAALEEHAARAITKRSPQFVKILGVPGIGKTRLVTELQRKLAGRDEPLSWRQGRSLAYGDGVSFWALREMVQAEAGILESDPIPTVEVKLRKAVHRTLEDPAEADRSALYLGALLGLGGEQAASADRRGEMFTAWRRFVEALASDRLLVLVFEDSHWADDTLLDFVDELVERVSGVPLLVVATARPDVLKRRPGWAVDKPDELTISLPALSESDTTHLVAALLERPAQPAETPNGLLDRIGGNPLYAEQFCRVLVEGGQLEELPESLHGIIAARLDALADVEKRLLQDAAVIGKVFWVGALEVMSGISRGEADELLQALVRQEFVQPARYSSVADDTEYVFGHELLRDVAYDEIPRAGKAERHTHAAEWIDSLGRPEDHAELLAYHYLAALDYTLASGRDVTDIVDRARQAVHRAGVRAMRLSANERSVEYFTRAIALVGQLPEGDERSRMEAELQMQLGVALIALRGLGAADVERAYTRATELMMAAPAAEQFSVDFGLTLFHGHSGNFDRSTRLVERLTDLASEGDETMRLQALHAQWMNSLLRGRIDDTISAADAGRGIYRPEAHHATSFRFGNHDPGVCALALQALAFALRGESARAVTQMHEAIALSETLGHSATLAQPLTQLPWALQINGDTDATLLASDRALALEDEVVHPQFFGIAHGMRGWALSRMGQDEEGVAELERALLDELQASNIWAAMIGALLAEVHLRNGRPDAARDILDQMVSLTRSMPTYLYEPELLRVEAEWMRLDGREDDARQLLLRAISTAREQSSWALAIRSGLALAHPLSASYKADLRLLADLYEHLPPENDTEYGRDAKALLGEGFATSRT